MNEFARSVAKLLFEEDEQLLQLNDRDPAKLLWLRRLISREFHTDSKLANDQLWVDAVKAINKKAQDDKRKSMKEKDKKSVGDDDILFK